MRKTITLSELRPWSRINEWEGEVTCTVEGRTLVCYVLMTDPNGWRTHEPGETLPADLRLERSGDLGRADPGRVPSLVQVAGVEYDLLGTVLHVTGPELVVDAGLVLGVDLDLPPGAEPPQLSPGDRIQVRGRLQVDLDPDDD